MKFFNQLLSLGLMASSAVYGLALPSADPLPIGAAAEEAATVLMRRQGQCMSVGIRPRTVDVRHQTNWQWVIREETRSTWDPNNNVHVALDAQTTLLDRHVAVTITNRSQRYGNAIILTRYAGNSNTGAIQDQLRVEVGLAVGREAATVTECIILPSLQGTWWWQLEN